MVKMETRWLKDEYFSPISGHNLLTLEGIQKSGEVLFLHDGLSDEFIHINKDYNQLFESIQDEDSDLDPVDQFIAALQDRQDLMVVVLNQQVTGCGGLTDLKTVIGLDLAYQG
jgi:hypothetical protein